MATKWNKLTYPERAYAWIRDEVFFSDYFEGIEEKYNAMILRTVEELITTTDCLSEREQKLYQLVIVNNMSFTEAAKEWGITYTRISQLVAKMRRKMHCRKCLTAVNKVLNLIVDSREKELFVNPKDNCDATIYDRSWDDDKAVLLRGYIVGRLNEYAENEKAYVDKASIRNILSVINEKGTTIEAIFNDIDTEFCDMMNQFFMEHPYVDPDDPEGTIQQTLYIDYNEVLRNRKPVGFKPKAEKSKKEAVPEIKKPFESDCDEKYEGPGIFEYPKKFMNFALYRDIPFPTDVIWFLKDAKVINKLDITESKYDEIDIANNLLNYMQTHVDPSDSAVLKNFFCHNDISNMTEAILYNFFCFIQRYSDEVRSVVIGKTAAIRAKFMKDCNDQYQQYRDKPVDRLFQLECTKIIRDALNMATRIQCIDDFLCEVIDGNFTTADLKNDKESIRIVNTALTRIPFIRYSDPHITKDIERCTNIAIAHLAYSESRRVARHRLTYIIGEKTAHSNYFNTTELSHNISVYNLKIFTESDIEKLRAVKIVKIVDLFIAVMNNYDFCECALLSEETVKKIYIYAAYIKSDVMVIQY